jgi:hypothetical protein
LQQDFAFLLPPHKLRQAACVEASKRLSTKDGPNAAQGQTGPSMPYPAEPVASEPDQSANLSDRLHR